MGLVLAQDLSQVDLIQDEGAVQEFTLASPMQRSAIACMRGVRTLHRSPRPLTLLPSLPGRPARRGSGDTPAGVFAGQPEDQCPDVPAGRRTAGLAAHGSGGPAAADDVTVPAQDRVRSNQQPQRLTARLRYHADQGCEQTPGTATLLASAVDKILGTQRCPRKATRGPRAVRWSRAHAGAAAGPCGAGRAFPRSPRG
jgi:hypothetical protein